MENESLVFRQFLSGRDHAATHPIAGQMLNFSYLVGDRETGEAVLVDPSWGPADLLAMVRADGLRLVGVLATHYHPDHIGGDMLGMAQVAGVRELHALHPAPLHCHALERDLIAERTGIAAEEIIAHEDGEEIQIGAVAIRVLHTPGHSPGGACYLVAGHLLSGDTLFLDGCGRTDLPGGDAAELHRSIHERLAAVPDEARVFPGHRYAPADSATLGEVRAQNYVFHM